MRNRVTVSIFMAALCALASAAQAVQDGQQRDQANPLLQGAAGGSSSNKLKVTPLANKTPTEPQSATSAGAIQSSGMTPKVNAVQPQPTADPATKPGAQEVASSTGAINKGVTRKKIPRKTKAYSRTPVAFTNSDKIPQKQPLKPVFYYQHSQAQHFGVFFYNTPCRIKSAVKELRPTLLKAGIDTSDRTILRHAFAKLPTGDANGCWYVDPRVGSFNLLTEDGFRQEFAREEIANVNW